METIPIEVIQGIPLFQKESMSLSMVIESVKWADELLEKANNGCWESRVDYVKLKKEGLPKRFFDKKEFDHTLIEEFNEKYNLRLEMYNSPTQRPCYVLNGRKSGYDQGEVLLWEQINHYNWNRYEMGYINKP